MTVPVYVRLAPFVLWAIVAGCSGTAGDAASTPTGPSSGPSTGPSPGPSSGAGCTAQVTSLPSSVPPDGGRYAFTITIAAGCGWTARADVTWADVAPGSGQGTATPVLTVATNTRTDTRTLNVTVNGQSFRAVQNANLVTCSYVVEPTSLDQGPERGDASVALTAPAGCAWTATASEGWIRMLTPSGTGSATIKIELEQNTGDARSAFLTVAGQRVNITQRRR